MHAAAANDPRRHATVVTIFHHRINSDGQLKVLHCKPVKEWLEKQKNQIEVFYLPSYSPELNPTNA